MGLLALGTPLDWPEAKTYAGHVRKHGILQFLNIWDRVKDRVGDNLLWGDEIEYMVISFDDKKKNARLSLRQSEILRELQLEEIQLSRDAPGLSFTIPKFHAEYGRYMLESTPGAPYGPALSDLLCVEDNMKLRRKIAKAKMKENEVPVTVTSFPRLGVAGKFLDPHFEPNGKASQSLFLPDEIINPHVRFPTLTGNIRQRRGSKVAMNMPIFIDEKTPRPFIDPSIPWDRNLFPGDKEAREGAALPDHIYMDSMGFGMGCCCLQITFQSYSVEEARRVYDALIPIGPIMLALTAGAPIFRGYLADVDCRWNVIAGSVDDRTEEERGLKPLKNDRFLIPKSRYDSVDCYLSEDSTNRKEYNDNPTPVDEEIKKQLMDHGIDELLSNHIAHLFIRDPLVVFKETLNQDDNLSSDHFENIQSTNWQTMRFKPPPPNSNIGWRVEFRSMEVQLTDFENAAFSIFIALLTRAILSFGLTFYIPISKVDENMKRAHKRDACRSQKFLFRKSVFATKSGQVMHHLHRTNGFDKNFAPLGNGHVLSNGDRFMSPLSLSPPRSGQMSPDEQEEVKRNRKPVDEEYEELTMDEIINGKRAACQCGQTSIETFPGLLGLISGYLNSLDVSPDVRKKLDVYLELIRKRASGELQTPATFIREFVRNHPLYKHDSVVSQEINYDLFKKLDRVERGEEAAPTLLGNLYNVSHT